ncbi:MAG: hypothetical protein ABIO72_04490 [Patescibacteria group bacterium]
MATVINTPGTQTDSSSGMALIVGVFAAIVLIVAFFVFALPLIRNGGAPQSAPGININAEIPLPEGSGGANTNPTPNSQ